MDTLNIAEHRKASVAVEAVSLKGRLVQAVGTEIMGRNVVVTGRALCTASIKDEEWNEQGVLQEPGSFIAALRERSIRADLFMFTAGFEPRHEPIQGCHFEWDNAAVVPITTFKDWWEGRLPQEARKNVRRSERRGVTVKPVVFDAALVAGIKRIYDETPVRQGRRFWHYQKDLETVERENSSYLDRSDFFGAFFEGQLIGFVKMVYVGRVVRIMQILSMNAHFDKRPANALLAKCVERCCERKMEYFVYGKYVYGNKRNSPVTEFKRRTGFEELRFRRYYAPLTTWGRVALGMRLHLGLQDILPERVTELLLKMRAGLYARTAAASHDVGGTEGKD